MKNQVKFKVGDLVYIFGSNKIGKIIELLNVDTVRVHNQKEYFHSARLCHATQENYERLSATFPNVEFEPPPKRKEPKEIIQSMLDDGWDCVPVIYLENGTKCMGYAKYSYLTMTATPFDPKTGKTIIDFVDGEVVLESENE